MLEGWREQQPRGIVKRREYILRSGLRESLLLGAMVAQELLDLLDAIDAGEDMDVRTYVGTFGDLGKASRRWRGERWALNPLGEGPR